MMFTDLQYKITAKVWLYKGAKASWHFVNVPEEDARQIKFFSSPLRRGWGAIPVQVTIGKTQWKTSIFPDSKTGTYILPLKAEVRKKENIVEGDDISFDLEVFA